MSSNVISSDLIHLNLVLMRCTFKRSRIDTYEQNGTAQETTTLLGLSAPWSLLHRHYPGSMVKCHHLLTSDMRWFHPPWPSCICFSTSVSRSQRTLSPTLKGQGMMGLDGSTASPAALGHTIITHLQHWTHHHHTPAALGHTIITHLQHWDTPSSHTCSIGHTITTHLQHWDTPSPHTCSIGTHHHHTPAALGHTIITHLQHWDTLFITHLQQCDRTHCSSHTCSTGTQHSSSHTCSLKQRQH